jgi:hypothetical protein
VTILAAQPWITNAHLIGTVHALGYLTDDQVIVDPTYGRGNWWKQWRPPNLIAHDLRLDGVDFRQLPEATGSVDAVAFDPPYIAQGGRDTSTLAKGTHDDFDRRRPDFLDRYGLDTVPTTPEGITAMAAAGITEFRRVLRPNGVLLIKAMNYVTGGRYRTQAYDILSAAILRGFRLVDELIHLRRPGPQPRHARQLTARRNYSLLFVLRRDDTLHHPDLFGQAVGT